MKHNVGLTDKLIRYGIAVVLISLHLSGFVTGGLGVLVLCAAFLLLATGILNFCPLYVALGKSTWSDENRDPGKY